jgi:hypothetical protein
MRMSPPKIAKDLAQAEGRRSQVRFRQIDLKRVLAAASSAGFVVRSIEVDTETGKIVLCSEDTASAKRTPLQEWQEKRRARTS